MRGTYRLVSYMLALADMGGDFKEQEHPRGSDGEFRKKGSSKEAPARTRSDRKPEAAEPEAKGPAARGLVHMPDRDKWPEHVKALKLPPAWTDVHVSHDPDADLQAIGRDQKGRPQYVYSQKFQDTQSAKKFERIHGLDKKFEDVYAENAKARKSKNPRTREHADVMHLIMTMGLRPGGESDTGADKKAYGASTLEGSHVVVNGNEVRLKFTGKKGVDIDLPVKDKATAKLLVERKNAAGDGQLFPSVRAGSLLEYAHGLDGGAGYKTKDFRTLLGTRLAYQAVQKSEPPKNEKEYKKAVRDVAVHVARHLGNTPTVALASYISPLIFSEWDHARQ